MKIPAIKPISIPTTYIRKIELVIIKNVFPDRMPANYSFGLRLNNEECQKFIKSGLGANPKKLNKFCKVNKN